MKAIWTLIRGGVFRLSNRRRYRIEYVPCFGGVVEFEAKRR